MSIDTQKVCLYGMVGAVVLLACILVIYGVFYLSVIGRIHQFGQLRTIGMTKKQMKKFVFHEGGALYLRSAPIGIVIGCIAGYFMIPDGFKVWNALLAIALVLVAVYIITMLSLALGGILFMTAATYMSSFDQTDYARQGYFTDAEFHIEYSQAAIELNENGMSGMQAIMPMDNEMAQEIAMIDGVEKVSKIKSFGVRFDYPKNGEYGNDDVIYPLTYDEYADYEHRYP